MNNNIDLLTVRDTFKETLDIPSYYIFCQKNDCLFTNNPKYAIIDNIDIYILGNTLFSPNDKINDIIRLCDDNFIYDLLIPITDYDILIINDIIKTLGGVIYEKTTLQY